MAPSVHLKMSFKARNAFYFIAEKSQWKKRSFSFAEFAFFRLQIRASEYAPVYVEIQSCFFVIHLLSLVHAFASRGIAVKENRNRECLFSLNASRFIRLSYFFVDVGFAFSLPFFSPDSNSLCTRWFRSSFFLERFRNSWPRKTATVPLHSNMSEARTQISIDAHFFFK